MHFSNEDKLFFMFMAISLVLGFLLRPSGGRTISLGDVPSIGRYQFFPEQRVIFDTEDGYLFDAVPSSDNKFPLIGYPADPFNTWVEDFITSRKKK